jgi:hypothetical protein
MSSERSILVDLRPLDRLSRVIGLKMVVFSDDKIILDTFLNLILQSNQILGKVFLIIYLAL